MRLSHIGSSALKYVQHLFLSGEMSGGVSRLMYLKIPSYRVVSFGSPMGPWRLRLTAARRDAIAEGLGCYDEWGRYFDMVPGSIEINHVCPRALGLSDDQIAEMITSEKRARLSARQPQKVRRSEGFPGAPSSRSMVPSARGRP